MTNLSNLLRGPLSKYVNASDKARLRVVNKSTRNALNKNKTTLLHNKQN